MANEAPQEKGDRCSWCQLPTERRGIQNPLITGSDLFGAGSLGFKADLFSGPLSRIKHASAWLILNDFLPISTFFKLVMEWPLDDFMVDEILAHLNKSPFELNRGVLFSMYIPSWERSHIPYQSALWLFSLYGGL